MSLVIAWRTWASRRDDDPRYVDVDTFWPPDRVAVRVETTQRQMSVIEVHTHHRAVGPEFRLRLVRGDGVGRLRWAWPAGGEVAPGPVGFCG